MSPKLWVLAHIEWHGQEICRDTQRQTTCLDRSIADDMGSHCISGKRAVLLPSAATLFSNESKAVGTSSLSMTRTRDALLRSKGTGLVDGSRAVEISSWRKKRAEDALQRSVGRALLDGLGVGDMSSWRTTGQEVCCSVQWEQLCWMGQGMRLRAHSIRPLQEIHYSTQRKQHSLMNWELRI